MAVSDSMFRFEVGVKDVMCYLKCKKFYLRTDFSDIFSIYLRNPNKQKKIFVQKTRQTKKTKPPIFKSNNKSKNDRNKKSIKKHDSDQSIMINSSLDLLREHMRIFPMELTIVMKHFKKIETGSIQIPWTNVFFNFLDNVMNQDSPREVIEKAEHHLYHDITSKRIATVWLQIKLSYINTKASLEKRHLKTDTSSESISYINNYLSTIDSITKNPGVIKTKYRGRDLKEYDRHKKILSYIPTLSKELDGISSDKELVEVKQNFESLNVSISNSNSGNDYETFLTNYLLNFDDNSDIISKNQVFCVGYCTVEKDFDNPNKTPSAVSSKHSVTPSKNSETSSKQDVNEKTVTKAEKYKLRICDSECPSNKERSCTQSLCSLDLPEEARPRITVKKCEEVACNSKSYRDQVNPSDSSVKLDLHRHICCDENAAIEVVGSMKAEMKISKDPCYCACECTFGFTKKTTYCGICGGYEEKGEDLAGQLIHTLPHPCPVFHKLMDKKSKSQVLSTSGSGSRKNITKSERSKSPSTIGDGVIAKDSDKKSSVGKGDKKQGKARKSSKESDKKIMPVKDIDKKEKLGKDIDKKKEGVESEKDKSIKKGKINKDEKFKFNYGYQGIPPQIGHSKCLLPCTGAMIGGCVGEAGGNGFGGRNVPKHMGWLWTAEDVPGMKVSCGWRPGAISKRLLWLLRKAKSRKLMEKSFQGRTKMKGKKRIEEKPMLVVNKKDGVYSIQMETANDSNPQERCDPLIYKVARKDNVEKIIHRKKITQKLVQDQLRNWPDPYHPHKCYDTCYKVYKQAIGLAPDDSSLDTNELKVNNVIENDCCSYDADSTSEGSSLDLDWEIKFSPPITRIKANEK